MHFSWLVAYFLLSWALAQANREVAPEVYHKIINMPIYKMMVNQKLFWLVQVILLVAIYFLPVIELVFVALEILIIGNRTTNDSDKLFN